MPSYNWDIVITLTKKKEEFQNNSELNQFWENSTPSWTKWIEFCQWTEYAIGLEWGMEGRLHFQCFFKHNKIKNKKSLFKTIKRLTDTWPPDMILMAEGNPHVSSSHDPKALVKYVLEPSKNRAGLLQKINVEEHYLGEDIPPLEKMDPWCTQALSFLESITDNRQILWIYDPSGGAGKSQLAKYLCIHKEGKGLGYGKVADIQHIAAQSKSKLFVANLTRARGRDVGSLDIFQALEGIRDGFFMDTKYKSREILRHPSKIIVFANIKPPTDQQNSSGRYWICKVEDKKLVTIWKDFDQERWNKSH